MKPISFNSPFFVGNELRYIAEAIQNGHISGNGAFSRNCESLLSELLGGPRCLLTTSCTDALEIAALLLDIQPGDEVIVPSFTFVSTANAFVLRGAKPVFADIRPDTLNIDETKVEALITPRTRAIVPVHYAGIGCEMDALRAIAQRHGIALVEDNAHGLLGKYRGQPLGSFGSLSTLSFHETKNFSCGEGGAIVINDRDLVQRAEILRDKGTNRAKFFRGEVDKYTWVDLGSSFLPSDILAAVLFAQLTAREQIQRKRRQIWETYHQGLQGWAAQNGVGLPIVPAHCEQSYHLFYVVLPTAADREAFTQHCKAKGFPVIFHYVPLHLSPMGRKAGGQPGDCPVTEKTAECLVRLPFHQLLSEAEQYHIVQTVRDFACARGALSHVA